MERLYKKINKIKLNNDSFSILSLKILYKSFSNSIFISILNIVIPFVFSLPIYNDTKKFIKLGLICLGVLILINIIHNFCNGYATYSNRILRGNQEIIDYVNSLYKTYNERIANNYTIGLFETISDSICRDLFHFFKDVFNIETRISLIQQYPDDKNNFRCFMLSRTSKHTDKLGSRKNDSKVVYIEQNNKYYNKILVDNIDGLVVLLKNEVEEKFVFRSNKSKKNAKIFQYVALPQKAYGKYVAFILQIDVLDKNGFGKSKEDIEEFVDKYVDPFVRILQNSYLVENNYIMNMQ